MRGIKRVLMFCILTVLLPITLILIPLYLRKTIFADVVYQVAESDIIEIRDGISSIFCQQHSLRMNTHFNAFQLRNKPEISSNRKHIRLKKSMMLPDDTLEYWGFYLLKGAMVYLKFCSRYDGSRILVVKGQRDLKTCGLLDHNKNKVGTNFAQGHEQVKVFFEDIAEIAELTPLKETTAMENNSTHTNDDIGRYMELENHGGEDVSSMEQVDVPLTTTITTTTTTNSSKLTHRKSKKNKKMSSEKLASINSDHIDEAAATYQAMEPPLSTTTTRHIVDERRTRSSHDGEREHFERTRRRIHDELYRRRPKRELVYDRKYSHGGNALNFTETDESNSISSFENGLRECYNGDILLAEGFPPSAECLSAHFLENGSHRMFSKHEVTEDGYYYYIFYSDNDLVRNDIHAIFDIYKPTFQYSNLSNSQGCVNATNCTFSIGFLSDEIVVVEVPTRDGIEHEEDDITYLISTCHPRIQVYAIFPIMVLLLILCCSFL